MSLYLVSFIAGLLTILAPCVLPLLPVILGGGIQHGKYKRMIIIVISFVISVVLFTGLIKFTSTLSGLSPDFWIGVSGGLLIVLGLLMVFPTWRNYLADRLGFEQKSQEMQQSASQKKGVRGDIALGASLGPVFTSCSPTYAVILGIVLPISTYQAFVNIIFYALGLGLLLALVGIGGIKVVRKLRWAAKPNGWFKRIVALLIVLTGVAILTGLEKDFEAYLLEKGLYLDTTAIEQQLIDASDTANN